MPILASEALLREHENFQWWNITPVSIEPLDLWFQVQHSPFYTNLAFACKTETLGPLYNHAPFYTNLAFACKTETLGSLYSHALLILTKSS